MIENLPILTFSLRILVIHAVALFKCLFNARAKTGFDSQKENISDMEGSFFFSSSITYSNFGHSSEVQDMRLKLAQIPTFPNEENKTKDTECQR